MAKLKSAKTFILLTIACLLLRQSFRLHSVHAPYTVDPYAHVRGYCTHTQPIDSSEFISRQQKLAHLLSQEQQQGVIYVAEPGANGLYFGNISVSSWQLSERPLLFVLVPASQGINRDNEIGDNARTAVHERPKIIILTPEFESTRAKLLCIPASGDVDFLEWSEDADPFKVLADNISSRSEIKSIYVDEMMRAFVWQGLRDAFPSANVKTASASIRSLRERKSAAELDLLKCANEATLLAIRAVRSQLHPGIHESQVNNMITAAITATGQDAVHALVLFGPDAALPHGSGTDRALDIHDLILIDAGGVLHGYHSDITRTFALKDSLIRTVDLVAWYAVQAAQKAAHKAAKEGARGMDVDRAARNVIEAAKYGAAFTHRLGHGIGLEGHEAPYLVGGNEQKLEVGNTFSNEPGVYLEGQVGIRLEDIFVVSETGSAEFLTSKVGGPAVSPWKP